MNVASVLERVKSTRRDENRAALARRLGWNEEGIMRRAKSSRVPLKKSIFLQIGKYLVRKLVEEGVVTVERGNRLVEDLKGTRLDHGEFKGRPRTVVGHALATLLSRGRSGPFREKVLETLDLPGPPAQGVERAVREWFDKHGQRDPASTIVLDATAIDTLKEDIRRELRQELEGMVQDVMRPMIDGNASTIPVTKVKRYTIALVDLNNVQWYRGREFDIGYLMKRLYFAARKFDLDAFDPGNVIGRVYCTGALQHLKDGLDGFGDTVHLEGLKRFPGCFSWRVVNRVKYEHGVQKLQDVDTYLVAGGIKEIIERDGEIKSVVLATGDKDMLPVVNEARARGIPVVLVSHAGNTATVLRKLASDIVYL